VFLEVRNLRSGYRQGPVLDGVDLDLADGHVLAVLGRNGVGKSTLLMTIMGLVRALNGTISINGRKINGLSAYEVAKAGVALVPQGRRVWPTLTVREHFCLAKRGRRAPSSHRRWTAEALERLLPRLAERRDQLAGTLSGGEQQMLAIARALLTQPSLIMLDEPSEGLAPLIVEQIGGILRQVASDGVAVLLVEQDLHLAFGVAKEIAVMARGKVVHRTDTAAFRADAATAHRLLGVES
jgi:branched-chain amino acid transport system ATP-binding protein